jgi:hypothetical protein
MPAQGQHGGVGDQGRPPLPVDLVPGCFRSGWLRARDRALILDRTTPKPATSNAWERTRILGLVSQAQVAKIK